MSRKLPSGLTTQMSNTEDFKTTRPKWVICVAACAAHGSKALKADTGAPTPCATSRLIILKISGAFAARSFFPPATTSFDESHFNGTQRSEVRSRGLPRLDGV
jgi:hypothetical protein